MKKVYSKLKNLAFLTALLVGSNYASAQVYVVGNGETAHGVSDDGKVVTLSTVDNNFYWTPELGIQLLGELAADTANGGSPLVTADGKMIAVMVMNPADGINQMATYNVETKVWKYLGGIGGVMDNETTSVWGMSPDGKYIVGLGATDAESYHGVKWSEATGMVDLGSTYNDNYSRANGVSDNGNVIAGWQDDDFDRWGVYWEMENKNMFLIKMEIMF